VHLEGSGSRLLSAVVTMGLLFLIAASSPSAAQTRISFRFASGASDLDPGFNAAALAELVRIFTVHDTRPGLRIWLVAELPAGCVAISCGERLLVTSRVTEITSAINERLPKGTPRLDLMYDAEEVGGADSVNLVDVRLDEVRPRSTPCPYLIEVWDPTLPPARSNPQEDLWLLLPPGHLVAVSRSARLRITAPADVTIHSLLVRSQRGQRELLRGSSGELRRREFALPFDNEREELSVSAQTSSERSEWSERTMRDVLAPWRPEDVRAEPEATLAAQCRFPIVVTGTVQLRDSRAGDR
jgi:hypothetical protein